MKNKLLIASLFVVLVALALGFTYQPSSQKWEYKVQTVSAGGDEYDTQFINTLGLSGWELVSTERTNEKTRTYFFKRQK